MTQPWMLVPPARRGIWTPWLVTQLVVVVAVLVSGITGAGILAFDHLDYGEAFDVSVPPATDVTKVTSVQEFGSALAGY